MSIAASTIVVGHDGSPFADRALEWALEWAEKTGLGVTVARAWTLRTAPRPSTWEPGYVPPAEDFAAAVRERLERDVADLVRERPDVEVQYATPRGPASNGLLDLSATAALVAVGPRGRGGFKGLVLGSVSEAVVRHAKCPVVVVRSVENPADTERSADLD
ncbi:universal stress protein [uncultured Aeromicrobium sp.]|uniref:universal stress protein n=1 Tax=uncultured Aeromicrobium sp. TaxID=337820 RepID=UPI0025E03C0D|nr:universal stress protein [uncultured Aeromicrobium sp.]